MLRRFFFKKQMSFFSFMTIAFGGSMLNESSYSIFWIVPFGFVIGCIADKFEPKKEDLDA